MQPLAEAAGWLFGWLLRNSAHAAILAALVWILERTVCRNLPPRWRYGLWLLVVARLLLPVGPESRLSLFNLVDLAPAGVAGAALQVLRLPPPVVVPVVEVPDPLADTPWWFIGALALWFSGALTLAGIVWRDHRRMRQALAMTSPVLDAEVLDLLRQSKAVMSVRQCIAVVETPGITSPAIAGWWRPRLLLPTGLLARLTPDEIRFLFLHELAHVKRADLPFNWVIAIIQILHWFNPVVWLTLRRLLVVREEVCDDLVLRRCFPGAARDYGLTLLRLLEECAPRRLTPALAGVLGDLHALRQRILCIRNFRLQDPHPCIPALITVAVAIVGLTERIGEPFFWMGPAHEAHDSPQVIEPASSKLRSRTGRRPVQLANEELEESGKRFNAASQVMGTLTAALRQVLEENQWTMNSGPSQGDDVSTSDPATAKAPASPAATVSQSVRFASGSSGSGDLTAGRLRSLPPINERGSILQPRSAPLLQNRIVAEPVTVRTFDINPTAATFARRSGA